MNIPEFVAKWKSSRLTERASAQSWFNDLCRVLGYPTPTDIDVDGNSYTFERGAEKTGGGDGWAEPIDCLCVLATAAAEQLV